MALKFLNKKGWHTGSLRNIENVWKAEQKHNAEEKKLEELRKQIHEERERSEFRQLQEQAGLVPRQERLEFLYDSGLAVGKGSSSSGVAFKALESTAPKTDPGAASSAQEAAVPGALFEDKPQSANDAWRKLHSDPLLMIRQKEQEALARVKNNPVRMAMIRKSVEEDTKNKEKLHDNDDDKKSRRKHHHKKDKSSKRQEKRKASDSHNTSDSSEGDHDDRDDDRRKRSSSKRSKHVSHRNSDDYVPEKKNYSERHEGRGEEKRDRSVMSSTTSNTTRKHDLIKRRDAVKLTDEERAAKLREMQMDAELHEDQRWKRLKKAEENDAKEAVNNGSISRGKNFLDVVQKNVYGTGNEGSATIEESVRRRTHYLQGRSDATERNAFRR